MSPPEVMESSTCSIDISLSCMLGFCGLQRQRTPSPRAVRRSMLKTSVTDAINPSSNFPAAAKLGRHSGSSLLGRWLRHATGQSTRLSEQPPPRATPLWATPPRATPPRAAVGLQSRRGFTCAAAALVLVRKLPRDEAVSAVGPSLCQVWRWSRLRRSGALGSADAAACCRLGSRRARRLQGRCRLLEGHRGLWLMADG